MTIGFTTLSLICGILSICHVVGKGTAAALGTFSALMGVIVWGIAAGMYYQKPCCETTNWLNPNKETTCFFTSQLNGDLEEVDVPAFKHMGKYGPAFGLAVTAWAVMVLGTIFAYLPF
ncbi:hypothetical protein AGDE_13868 [Angomonas deanei]|uniref:Amastin surface glycoprotein, putative n=1 Tax=Angomonas deanei TaxID=59799 RepID=A0A7G2CJG8_9TRYP|nr:hypothetical protein AGDE_13868 [Angomonas deanei]CAD2219197.1 Amastin surface glycoprotein, putative [Angomonas deanei]|eukprot:EPY21654.1 hypothetical protein AGDE_13868 [Angomonas deanei]